MAMTISRRNSTRWRLPSRDSTRDRLHLLEQARVGREVGDHGEDLCGHEAAHDLRAADGFGRLARRRAHPRNFTPRRIILCSRWPVPSLRPAHPPSTCPIVRWWCSTCAWSWTWIWRGGGSAGGRSLTLGVRRDAVAAVELHAVDMQIDEITVDDKADQRLPLRRRAAAHRSRQASRARRPARAGGGLPGLAPPGAVLHRARRGSPGAAAAVLDPGAGRGQPRTTGRASTCRWRRPPAR